MSNGVQYVVLCEDLQTQVFIRRALLRRKINSRRARFLDLPADTEKGAGDGYVIRHHPKQVEAHRIRAAHTQAALIVHVDADPRNDVSQRLSKLQLSLSDAQMEARHPQERIAYLIPKRNIETWIHFYLDGPPIEEATEYAKLKGHESDCGPAAEAFSDDAAENNVPSGAPPSLVAGLAEFRRIL